MALRQGLNTNGLPYKEVDLFRQMLLDLKHYYHATIMVSETHQHYVCFDAVDPITKMGVYKRREISDLLLIAYSPKLHIARATFLQAKVARNGCGLKGTKFNFNGEYFQYYLLSQRPIVICANCGHPYDFLKNAYLPSIGSYGVFYKDASNKVNFAYQPAELLKQWPPSTDTRTWHFECDNSNTYYSPKGIPDLYCTYDIDIFETELINLRLGSPIQINRHYPYVWHHIHHYMHHYVHSLITHYHQDPRLVSDVVDGLEEFDDFLISNVEHFLSEGQEKLRNIEEYERVKDLNIPLAEYNGDNARGEEQLCRGAYSFALINVDKIHSN